MSGRLPMVTARQMVAALKRAGFVTTNQTGSHLRLKHPMTGRITIVAIHCGDLKRPMIKVILKEAGVSEEEFRKLL